MKKMVEESSTWNKRIMALCNGRKLYVEYKLYRNCVVKDQFKKHLALSST